MTADSFREDRGSGPEGTSTGATIWEGGVTNTIWRISENSICRTPTWAMKSQKVLGEGQDRTEGSHELAWLQQLSGDLEKNK